jgi:hypothetical protein
MFRILCDPSSGSTELCMNEITRGDSQIFCRVFGRFCIIECIGRKIKTIDYNNARWKPEINLKCIDVHEAGQSVFLYFTLWRWNNSIQLISLPLQCWCNNLSTSYRDCTDSIQSKSSEQTTCKEHFLFFHNDAHNYKITGILKQLKFRRSLRHFRFTQEPSSGSHFCA